jgi:hypothetical protein
MLRSLSHPDDMSMFAGIVLRVLRLGDPAPEWADPGECPITHTDLSMPCRSGGRRGESADVGGPAFCRGAVWTPSSGAADAPGWALG